MSEPILCPICETPNDPSNSNCEVCGERLAPLAEGEFLSPEENVSAMLDENPAEFEVRPGSGEVMGFALEEYSDDVVDEGFDAAPYSDDDEGAEVASFEVEPLEVDGFEDDGFEDDGFAADGDDPGPADDAFSIEEISEPQPPAYLYSSVDGTAYPAGSPEYEDGFGPMGDELLAQPPGELAGESAGDAALSDFGGERPEFVEPSFDDFGDDVEAGGFENDYDEGFDAPEPEPARPLITPSRSTPKEHEEIAPLPTPATYVEPATVTVYQNRLPIHTYAVDADELLIGRRDPVADAYPDIDVSDVDPDGAVSRKHAYIYRQHKNYTLYVISNTGTQLNSELLNLGDRRQLSDGDVIVLAGRLAMKFQLPQALQ